MGNNASVSNGDSVLRNVNYTHGNHVIKVNPGTPGERGGLTPFFDYLVEANGVLLDKDNVLIDFLSVSTGKEIKFVVYNSKREDYRETIITPDDWNGQSKLGVSVRFTEIRQNMMEFVWHILEVSRNSPASEAGLIENYDYIVGTTKSPFTNSEEFFGLVSRNHLKPIELYVYNVVTDKVRLITLTPNPSWGGSGCLGCEIGFGLLHRIPSDETRKTILQKYEQEVPKAEPFPDYAIHPSPIPQSPSPSPSPSPAPVPVAQNPLPPTPIPSNLPPSSPFPNPPTPQSSITPQVVPLPVTPQVVPLPVTPNFTPTPMGYQSSPYYPQIASPYKAPSTPQTPLSTPLSPIGNSPSIETLQRLREKQAQLQEQLKSIQLNSPTLNQPN